MSHYIFSTWGHFHVYWMPGREWSHWKFCKRDIVSLRENPSRSLWNDVRFFRIQRLFNPPLKLCIRGPYTYILPVAIMSINVFSSYGGPECRDTHKCLMIFTIACLLFTHTCVHLTIFTPVHLHTFVCRQGLFQGSNTKSGMLPWIERVQFIKCLTIFLIVYFSDCIGLLPQKSSSRHIILPAKWSKLSKTETSLNFSRNLLKR